MANYERRRERAAEWNDRLDSVTPPWTKRAMWSLKAATHTHLPSDLAQFGNDTSYEARRATLEAEWRGRGGLKSASIGWALIETFPAFRYAGIWRALSDGGFLVIPILVKAIVRFAQQGEWMCSKRAHASREG